jgi:hypothetical protein
LLIANPTSSSTDDTHGKNEQPFHLAADETKMVWLSDFIQDFGLQFWFRCDAECHMGVVFGMRKESTLLSRTYAAISGRQPVLEEAACGANGGGLSLHALPLAIDPPPALVNPLPPPKVFPASPGHPLAADDSEACVMQGQWNQVELRVVGDTVQCMGWWEQPSDPSQALRTFHPEAFGRSPTPGNPGGGQMYAYDVNGDGLSDVITSLEGHGRASHTFHSRLLSSQIDLFAAGENLTNRSIEVSKTPTTTLGQLCASRISFTVQLGAASR